MAQCYFCDRKFENRQGVRAHLKSCEAYQNRDPQSQPDSVEVKAEPTGRPAYKAIEPKEMPKAESYDPASHVRRQIVVRKPQTIHSAFQLDEIAPTEEAEIDEGSKHPLLRAALEDAKEVERRQRIKHARIETGKRFADEMLRETQFLNIWDRYTAAQEVEEALNRELTGEDSPVAAEQIADGVLTPWLRKEALHEKEQQQKESDERRQKRKRIVIQYGEDLSREAAYEENMSIFDKITFLGKVRRKLEKEFDGNEVEEDVEEMVEEVLDRFLEEKK